MRRFAPTARATVRTLREDFSVTLHFKSDDDRPAAVGFELAVDGFRLDLSLPGADALATSVLPPPLLAVSKLGYLRDTFRTDAELPDDLNSFRRDWLLQILLSALLADATMTGRMIDAVAADLLDEGRLEGVFHNVMDELFGAMQPSLADHDEIADDDVGDDSEDEAPDSAPRKRWSEGRCGAYWTGQVAASTCGATGPANCA